MAEPTTAPGDDEIVLVDTGEDVEGGSHRLAADFVPAVHNRLCQNLRHIISQKRNRFKYQGLDLDLAYITDRIIAVGYPSEGWEKCIRNTMNHTVEFLKRRHGEGKVKVFNLRGGFLYNPNKFNNNVIYFDMKDHHPPSLELMAPFCREAREWLDADVENVIAVHCKAGKGRTGVMICAYLIYSQFYQNPRQVLDYYSIVRTSNNKGVTIPSQRRYIYYYNMLREQQLNYFPLRQELIGVYLERPPETNGWLGTSKIKIKVSNGTTVVFQSPPLHIDKYKYREEKASWLNVAESNVFWNEGLRYVTKRAYSFMVPAADRVFVEGDVRVDLLNDDRFVRDKKIGHVWFNTMFTCRGMSGRDFVYGDKQWPYRSAVHTSIGYKGEPKHRPEDLLVPKIKTEWNIQKPRLWDGPEEMDAVEAIYKKHNITPPREKITEQLFDAHNRNIVKDDWNDRQKKLRGSGDPYSRLGAFDPLVAVGGPFQIPFKDGEHVLTFPVYEMDRALKNKKLSNGMKLHVVLRCIDSEDPTQSRLAKQFCDGTHVNTERVNLQASTQSSAMYPLRTPSENALGAEKKIPPSVRYAKDGGYNGEPHKNLTEESYKDEQFAKDPRWCRYYYRQRSDSNSKWPSLHHTCHLTHKTFNYDTGNGGGNDHGMGDGGDNDSQQGPAPGTPDDPAVPPGSTPDSGPDKNSDQAPSDDAQEMNDEAATDTNKTSDNEPRNQSTGEDEQSTVVDCSSGDPLLSCLRKNYEESQTVHTSLVLTYQQHGAADEDIKNMMSPDSDHEPLEDPDFNTRGVEFRKNGDYVFKDAKQLSTPEQELVDHLTAQFAEMYVRDCNEVERKYRECNFKRKAKRFELDYATAECRQRKYTEWPNLMLAVAGFIENESARLKNTQFKKKNKAAQLFARFTDNKKEPSADNSQSFETTVLDSRWSEVSVGDTIGK